MLTFTQDITKKKIVSLPFKCFGLFVFNAFFLSLSMCNNDNNKFLNLEQRYFGRCDLKCNTTHVILVRLLKRRKDVKHYAMYIDIFTYACTKYYKSYFWIIIPIFCLHKENRKKISSYICNIRVSQKYTQHSDFSMSRYDFN